MLEKLLKNKTVYEVVSTCYSETDSLIKDIEILKTTGLYLCTGTGIYACKAEALKDINYQVQMISDRYENVVIEKDGDDVTVRYEQTIYKSKLRMEFNIIERRIK